MDRSFDFTEIIVPVMMVLIPLYLGWRAWRRERRAEIEQHERVRVGLFARSHAFLDAADPQVERIVTPTGTA